MKKVIIAIFVLHFACTKKTETIDPVSDLVSTKDANKVLEILITPAGGEVKQGEPPIATVKAGTLEIKNVPSGESNVVINNTQSKTVTANQSTKVYQQWAYSCNDPFLNGTDCAKARGIPIKGLAYCVFRVKGSTSFRLYLYNKSFGNNGSLNFPFQIPDNLDNGEFDTEFAIVDEFGFVSNYSSTKVIVKRIADKDNPAKAYGCDLTKVSNDLATLIDKLSSTPSSSICEQIKVRYSDLVASIISCNKLDQATVTQLKQADKDMQNIDCSVFNLNAIKILIRTNAMLNSSI